MSKGISAFERQLQKTFEATESDELAEFLNDRWKSFAAFKRQTNRGSVVMTGSDEMFSDFLPGDYNLVDIACFSDLPPLEPRHTVIKGVKWVSSNVPGISGRVIFPDSFDDKKWQQMSTLDIMEPVLQKTSKYKYRFATDTEFKTTYENGYLEKYAKRRGCGIETHPFAHLDCPLDSNSGLFVIGKQIGNELHLSAFQVPSRHTVYIPAGIIHSNDYLIGTWRTMLSDEAVIDHVLTVREKKDGANVTYENIQLSFE